RNRWVHQEIEAINFFYCRREQSLRTRLKGDNERQSLFVIARLLQNGVQVHAMSGEYSCQGCNDAGAIPYYEADIVRRLEFECWFALGGASIRGHHRTVAPIPSRLHEIGEDGDGSRIATGALTTEHGLATELTGAYDEILIS